MGDGYNLKEVYYHDYCYSCKYRATDENDDPCDECLSNPVNLASHKPVNYVEGEGARGNDREDTI